MLKPHCLYKPNLEFATLNKSPDEKFILYLLFIFSRFLYILNGFFHCLIIITLIFCYKLKVIHILICILKSKEKRVEINPIKFELFHTPIFNLNIVK